MISFPLSLLVNLKARQSQHYYHSYTLFILTDESSSVELMKALAKGFFVFSFPKKAAVLYDKREKRSSQFPLPHQNKVHFCILSAFKSFPLNAWSILSFISLDSIQFQNPVVPRSRRDHADKNIPLSSYRSKKKTSPVFWKADWKTNLLLAHNWFSTFQTCLRKERHGAFQASTQLCRKEVLVKNMHCKIPNAVFLSTASLPFLEGINYKSPLEVLMLSAKFPE